MNKTNYEKFYNERRSQYFKEGELKIKQIFLNYKKKGKVIDSFQNRLLLVLEALKLSKYYVITSKKFNEIIKNFEKNYGYDKDSMSVIFRDEMLNDFNRVKNLKKGYTYEMYLDELAKVKVIELLNRRYRKWWQIHALMYLNNDFKNFSLGQLKTNYENDERFIEQKVIMANRENPGSYKDINDYMKQDRKLLASINNSRLKLEDKKTSDKRLGKDKIEKFELKKEYQSEDVLKKIYNILSFNHLTNDTNLDDFINVLTKDLGTHKSYIKFCCSTQEVAYLLYELQFLGTGKGFSFAKIERSKRFISFENNPISANNLSSSKKVFKPINNFINLNSNQLDIKRSVEKVIKEIKLI